MKALIFISNFLITPIMIFAQEGISNKFSITVGGGLAVPVGVFASHDVEASFDSESSAFLRGENGFAKPGYHYYFKIEYANRHRFVFNLMTGKYNLAVNTDPMEQYWADLGQDVTEEYNNYNTLYIMPGIGYKFSKGKFESTLSLNVGYARADFPYFKRILVYTISDPKIYVAHRGDQPKLSSVIGGVSMSAKYWLSKKISTGLEILYMQSSFDYHMEIWATPGGSWPGVFDDTLNEKLINLGFSIGYVF